MSTQFILRNQEAVQCFLRCVRQTYLKEVFVGRENSKQKNNPITCYLAWRRTVEQGLGQQYSGSPSQKKKSSADSLLFVKLLIAISSEGGLPGCTKFPISVTHHWHYQFPQLRVRDEGITVSGLRPLIGHTWPRFGIIYSNGLSNHEISRYALTLGIGETSCR